MLSPCFTSQIFDQSDDEPWETYDDALSNHRMDDDDKGVLREHCLLAVFGRCNHR